MANANDLVPAAAPATSLRPLSIQEDALKLLQLANRQNLRVGFRSISDRYSEHRGGVVRFLDPVHLRIVSVGTFLAYDNWLLRWIDPTILDLESPSSPWQCLHHGTRLSIKPTVTWTRGDGRRVLELVVRQNAPNAAVRGSQLRVVAQAHGALSSVRTDADVRTNLVLLENLDSARRAMCNLLTPDSYEQGSEGVLWSLFGRGPVTRDELLGALIRRCPELTEQCAHSLLFSMHRQGLINLNLEEVRYGPRTLVRAL